MKNAVLILLASAALSACVTAPTDPAELAAWNAEKTARTESRRPAPGSVLPGYAQRASTEQEVQDFKDEFPAPELGEGWQ